MLGFFSKQDINKGVRDFAGMEGAVLLDVRTKDEYRNGHVPGSVNIDVGDIKKTPSIIKDQSTPLFVYCHSGSRSGMAVSTLKRMGYANVKNIGGIISYTGPIERGS